MNIPPFAKSFITDFVETVVAIIFTLNLVIPGSLDEAKAQATIVGAAVLSAAISAARRAAPGFIAWVKEKVGS